MSGPESCEHTANVIRGAGFSQLKPLTVGEHLDQRIASAREKLEAACVAKAKADAMGWLAYPINDFANIVYPDGPF